MKPNIDLTFNRDFRKPDVKSVSLAPRKDRSIVLVDNESDSIKDSELETDFLTGSFSRINDKKFTFKVIRSAINIEASCDRCGGFLYIKRNTLCYRCDEALDSDLHESDVMTLLRNI